MAVCYCHDTLGGITRSFVVGTLIDMATYIPKAENRCQGKIVLLHVAAIVPPPPPSHEQTTPCDVARQT